jgi:hypothetical protein
MASFHIHIRAPFTCIFFTIWLCTCMVIFCASEAAGKLACFYMHAWVHQPMICLNLWWIKFTCLMGNIQISKWRLRDASFQGTLPLWCRFQWDSCKMWPEQEAERWFEAGVIMSTAWTHPSLWSATYVNTSSMSLGIICAICGIPCDSCWIAHF